MNHNDIEQELIHTGLDFPDRYSVALKEQFKIAKVLNREMTGIGFFTKYKIPKYLSIHENFSGIWYLGVDLLLGPEKFPGASMLFIGEGLISTLEGWAIYGTWDDPLEPCIFTKDSPDKYLKMNKIQKWDRALGFGQR